MSGRKEIFFVTMKEEVLADSELVLMQWNVQGMTNVKKNWKLWESVDIVVFQETFLEEKRIESCV